jgi:enamine deaminase RidA (YjgF/YER057c/UK114 family)
MVLPNSAFGLGENAMSADARIVELGLELPPAPKPGGNYIPVVQVGELLYVSGHGPLKADKTLMTGKVGQDVTEEEAYLAARQVGLAILATLKKNLGSLDRVVRMVKVLGMVNAVPDFQNQPKVINGFSDLMVEVFGDAGRGARSAVGMGSLPSNITVEVECIMQIRDA